MALALMIAFIAIYLISAACKIYFTFIDNTCIIPLLI